MTPKSLLTAAIRAMMSPSQPSVSVPVSEIYQNIPL